MTRANFEIRNVAILLALPWYLVCWQIAYYLINQDFNLAMSYDYFVMAWTFSAGVRPFFAWVFSLAIFLASVGVIALILRRSKRRSDNAT